MDTKRPTPEERPDLYECAECSADTGAPTLCQRCFRARAAAGAAWIGPRPPEPTLPPDTEEWAGVINGRPVRVARRSRREAEVRLFFAMCPDPDHPDYGKYLVDGEWRYGSLRPHPAVYPTAADAYRAVTAKR